MCLRIFLTCYTVPEPPRPLTMYIKVVLVTPIHLHIFINFNNLMLNFFILLLIFFLTSVVFFISQFFI